MTRDSALQFAKTVWGGVQVDRASHFRAINPSSSENWSAHAIDMGWVIVDGDQIKRGPINPIPPEPALSRFEARTRWGPDWIG
jgi:hypothetical protein